MAVQMKKYKPSQHDVPVVVVGASADRKPMEAEVEQYRQFFQSSRDALMTFAAPSWVFTCCNRATLELFGVETEKEFFSYRPWDISSERQPDGQFSADKAREMIETAAREGFHLFEWQHQKIGGAEFPADVLLTCTEQKGNLFFQASVRDITGRKRAVENLRASEAKVRVITEAAQDAILMMDPDGRISYWNPAAESIFGYSAEEAIGNNLHELLVHEPHLSAHRTAYPEFQRTGQGNAIGKTVELFARRKDGQEISVSVSLAAVTLDGARHSVGIVRDISARKQMEVALSELNENLEQRVRERTDALRESKAHLAAVLESTADGILAVDNKGKVIRASRRFSEIWRIPEPIMKSGDDKALLEFVLDQLSDPDGFIKKVQSLYESNEESFDTFTFKDGRFIERYSFGMIMDGICIGRVWSFRDVTVRKALEARLAKALLQANAASKAKSEFLGIMTHELRNPLSGVLGFVELLSNTALNDEQMDYVRTISSSSEHLLAVVNDTLDFSSIEAGTMTIHAAPFDLADLLKLSSDIVRKSAAEKGLAFHCDVASDVSAQISGDERRIRQILINLLANAVKFTSKGSVSLRVTRSGGASLASRPLSLEDECPLVDSGETFLNFSVEDTGPGISHEAHARLFQLFTQADSTIHQKYGGTGIGLAVSQRLAEAMGGTISVVSAPGKGSTFTFRFPLEPAPVPAGAMVPVPSRIASQDLPLPIWEI